jgi:hypothetical protein
MKLHALSLALLLCLPHTAATAAQPRLVLSLGEAMAPLSGPWRFRVGDDLRWAAPGFDDSSWETVDLAAPASATDGDVGLPHYAPGWSARGHGGYYGYAWYRIAVSVRSPMGESLALLGPWAVDSAYQVYVNGSLLGAVGDFSGITPVAYGYHYPTSFVLPSMPQGDGLVVIAIRVWMGPWGAARPGAGGIHIAPAIGERHAIAAQYHLEWLKIFAGYAVDAIPALLLFLAAIGVLCLQPFDRGGRTFPWLAVALTLSAIQRGNQAFFFWLRIETIREFVIFIIALNDSLSLGAWMMAWRAWFKVMRPAWLPGAIAVLTVVLFLAQLLARPWLFDAGLPHSAGIAVHDLITTTRLAFLLVLMLVVYEGLRRLEREEWYALPAVLAIGAVLFSPELVAVRVPGIWFPWGVGLSLSECASVAFVLLLFFLLLRRLWFYARRQPI